MARRCVCWLVVLSVAAVAANVSAQALPEGEGRATVVTVCASACHGPGPIAPLRLSADRWGELVDEMINRGADVRDADRAVILRYLTQHLGAGVATPQAPAPLTAPPPVGGQPAIRTPAAADTSARTSAATSSVAPPTRDFPLVGGNLANQRYSALKQIDRSNVSRLGGAWTINLEGGRNAGNMQATPVVIDGVMYITSGAGNVFAIDAVTGAITWTYTSQAKAGAMTNRGVAVAGGRVFAGQRDNSLIALDQRTGALVWRTQLSTPGRGYTSAPAVYYDGLVYMGVAGGENGVRGQFGAYDAATGKEVWKFFTIPGPGEKGHETWEGDSWKFGGAPVWTTPAIDPELGMVYIAVGNAGPDNDGTKRGGDNLFTASIVALDLKTGAYKWHFQEVHHDIWDYDNSAAPLLTDITYQGQPRKILAHAGKTGFLYLLDRTNGVPLIGIEERPVPQEPRMKTAATQPFPIGDAFVPTCPEPGSVPAGYQSSCIFGAYWTEPVVMTPGTQGGVSWAPITFSPDTRLVYVPGTIMNSGHTLRRQDFNETTQRFDNRDDGAGYFRPPGQPRAGNLTAIDPATNRIVWQKRMKFPMGTGSGLLSTAGGLLWHGESDGNLVAYDIRTGDVLWKFQTGAGADAPVATYEVNGEQYVAILAGGNGLMLSARGDRLWAFKLDGRVPQAAAPPEPPTIQPGGTAGIVGGAGIPPPPPGRD
jgi:quinohemoprotein ethanol dehydrogenase